MLNGISVWFSELLFSIMGGVPIANSIWFIPYVVVTVLILAIVVWHSAKYIATHNDNENYIVKRFAVLIATIVSIMFVVINILGVVITQMNIIEECVVNQESLEVAGQTWQFDIKMCRVRENMNRFAEWGEWEFRGISRSNSRHP